METGEAIKKVYDERRDFIVIGLTGRTGSGCSTVAKILKKNTFKDLKLKEPKTYDYHDSEERKYSILYKYAKSIDERKEWVPFEVIEVSSIIASFIFEAGFDKTLEYLKKLSDEEKIVIHDSRYILKKISKLKDSIEKIQHELNELEYGTSNIENSEKICDVYLNRLPIIALELKNILSGFFVEAKIKKEDPNYVKSNLYTLLFQIFGNNIRASGNPLEDRFDSNSFLILSERINKIIKAIRCKNKSKRSSFVCIDAIRNPFEATFFRERYSAFYLISVNTDDFSRRKRLSYLSKDSIDSLDKIEYPENINTAETFYHQNIAACLEIADIHIYNRNAFNNDYYFLTEQVLKYLVLIWHPGLVTPTSTERCMQVAYNAKMNSGCLSRQVGAVVTDEDFSVKSIGWNDVPKGQVPCNLRDCNEYLINKDIESYSNYEITDKDFEDAMSEVSKKIKNIDNKLLMGHKYPYCFKDVYNALKNKDNQVYTRALHAEENAFLQIAKYGGQGVRNGFLFTTASPCELCAKKAYQLGIKKIYYIDPYPGISQSHILSFGSGGNPEMHLFYGAIGKAYIALYTPKMPLKDELEMLTDFKTKRIIESWRIINKGE